MPIDKDEVRRIAGLAKLSINDEELESFAEQFQEILDYFTQLEGVATDQNEATYHIEETTAAETPFREDQVRPSLQTEEAVKDAPDKSDNQFKVPGVIE